MAITHSSEAGGFTMPPLIKSRAGSFRNVISCRFHNVVNNPRSFNRIMGSLESARLNTGLVNLLMFLLPSSYAYLEKKKSYIVYSKISINELALLDMQVQIEQLLVSGKSALL